MLSSLNQAINVLQMWRTTTDNMSFNDVKARCVFLFYSPDVVRTLTFCTLTRSRLDATMKDFEYGPFDVAPEFFTARRDNKDWLDDRVNKYFIDANLMPLFVQVSRFFSFLFFL